MQRDTMPRSVNHKICALQETLLYESSIREAHILVVDDDPLIVNILTAQLSFIGCINITCFSTPEEAILYSRTHAVDILIMDIRLTHSSLDGISSALLIKKHTECTLIYISGLTDHSLMDRIKETAPLGFIQKPISVENLRYTLELAHSYHHMFSALQRSETRYQALTAATTDYIYHVRFKDGQPITTDHRPGCYAITGYGTEEFERDPDLWIKIVHPDEQDIVRDYAERLLQDHTAEPIEHRIVKKNGEIHWIRNTPVLHYNEKGDLIAYDGLIQDITELKQAFDIIEKERDALEAVVEKRTHRLLLEIERHMRDLEMAKKIQKVMLPSKITEYPLIKIAYKYRPLEALGGDFLFHTKLSEDRVGILIGDVTGHGVQAGLYTSCLKVLAHTLCPEHGLEPGDLLSALNKELLHLVNNQPSTNYLTSIYGVFHKDPEQGQTIFSFANGGHPPVLVHHKSNNHIKQYSTKGTILGFSAQQKFDVRSIALAPGDRVFLFTDGMFEERHSVNIIQDLKRFSHLIKRMNIFERPIEQVLHTIITDMIHCHTKRPIEDDMMIVGIDIK